MQIHVIFGDIMWYHVISCDIWVPHDGPTTSLDVAQERENDRKKGKMPDPRMMMRQAQWGDPDNR